MALLNALHLTPKFLYLSENMFHIMLKLYAYYINLNIKDILKCCRKKRGVNSFLFDGNG